MPHHFQSSQSVRVLHTAVRRRRLEVQVLVRAPFQMTKSECRMVKPPRHSSFCIRHSSFLPVSVADLERHRSRKSDHVSANLTGGSISNTLHIVTAAFLVVNEAVPVRIRLWEPFHHRAQGKEPSQRSAKPRYPVRAWGACPPFHRIRESQRTHLVWDQDRPGAAPGYPTISIGL